MAHRTKRTLTAAAKENAARPRLGDVAYQKVLEGLFNRSIPTGAFLSQSDLVKLLDIPVQPLRDALKILEAEGVVTIHPRSGIEFLKLDLELTRTTYQFRTIIERAAAMRYAETGKMSEFIELKERHLALVADIKSGMFDDTILERFEALENELHSNMVASLHNPLVTATAARLKNYVRLILLERLLTPPLALKSLEEHITILENLEKRDMAGAEAAVSAHFQAAQQRLLGMF